MADDHADAATTERYTLARAEQHGHLHVWEQDGEFTADCESRATGDRCLSFATYSSRDSLRRRFIEHAAEYEGVCWACSRSEDRWPNRYECDRCWLMWNAHNGVLPRDAGPRESGRGGNDDR